MVKRHCLFDNVSRALNNHLLLCRLDQYLEYVVTYTDDTAYLQAAKADRLFAEVGSHSRNGQQRSAVSPGILA